MLSVNWKDSKIDKKADKVGIAKDHKYRDRARSINVKESFIDRYLKDYINPVKPFKVLDISTGTGVFVELMNDYGNIAVGTEIPNSVYTVYHESQGTDVTYHDSSKVPFPFKKVSFDLVTCVGAFDAYQEDLWVKIIKDIFRMSKHTVLIGFNLDEVYNRNIDTINSAIPKNWKLTVQNGSIYRWDKA